MPASALEGLKMHKTTIKKTRLFRMLLLLSILHIEIQKKKRKSQDVPSGATLKHVLSPI
jgi:hypothetical protein